MRRLLFTLLLFSALATPATTHAYTPGPYGCNLRWDQCFGDAGVMNKSFACNTNSGNQVLVGSFKPAWDIADVGGLEIVMQLAADGATLPAWWAFRNSGSCRQSSLSMGFTIPVTASACADWAPGEQDAGGLANYQTNFRGPNSVRMLAAIAVPPGFQQFLSGLHEYFAFTMTINNAKTVGTGSCAGCLTPVCISLDMVKMTTPTLATTRVLFGPSNFTDSNFATWQGGGNPTTSLGSGCPAATPTRQQTWGAVKSLYR